MVIRAIETINRFLVGADGTTAHHRIYGSSFKGIVFDMGEQLWAKPTRHSNWAKLSSDPKRKLSLKTNGIEGTWVGFDVCTNE